MLTGLPPFYSQDVQEMYRKIMTDRLTFPDFMHLDARSLLEQVRIKKKKKKRKEESNQLFFCSYWNVMQRND
jgi:hypothetical protein